MSDNSTEIKRSVKDILVQARDDIAITYWVQNKEFDYGNWDYIDELPKYREVKVEKNVDDAVVKDATVDADGRITSGKAAITGVCSIGAVALATMTLYDVPLDDYSSIAERDPYTRAAAHILAAAITAKEPEYVGYDSEAELIATWNDYNGRTRDEVLDVFDDAIKHPLVAAEELWGIRCAHNDPINGIVFATEHEAEQFAELVNSETDKWERAGEDEKDYWAPSDKRVMTLIENWERTDWQATSLLSLKPALV